MTRDERMMLIGEFQEALVRWQADALVSSRMAIDREVDIAKQILEVSRATRFEGEPLSGDYVAQQQAVIDFAEEEFRGHEVAIKRDVQRWKMELLLAQLGGTGDEQ